MNQRRALWLALADLFLDTEVRWFVPRAAYCAVDSGFGWDETEHILYHEVGPVVGGNLLNVAGEWAGWDSEWLCRTIEERRRGVLDTPRALLLKLHFGDMGLALRRLHEYFSTTVDPDELPRLEAMAHLYLDRDWTRHIGLWSHLRKLEWWSADRLCRSWDCGIEPVYRDLVYPGRVATDASPRQAQGQLDVVCGLAEWADGQGRERGQVIAACEELSYLFTVGGRGGHPPGRPGAGGFEGISREV